MCHETMSLTVLPSLLLRKASNWSSSKKLGEGVQRDTITYNATSNAGEKGVQGQQALVLFERMLGEGAQRSTITDHAAIGTCEKNEEWQQAL